MLQPLQRSRFVPFALLLLLGALLAPRANAQITITSEDFEEFFDRGQYGYTNLAVAGGEAVRIQAILDAIGAGGTYDFGEVQVTTSFIEAELQTRPFGPEVPTDPPFDQADFVNVTSIFGSEPSYSFSGLNGPGDEGEDGIYTFGSVTTGLSTTTYDPPIRRFPLPMTYGTTWSSEESTVTQSVSVFDETYTTSVSGEVIGYGTLIVPGGGEVDALVHRVVTVEDEDTTRAIEFFDETRLVSATVQVDENGDVIVSSLPNGTEQPAAFFQLSTNEAAQDQISSNATGSYLQELLGIAVDFTDGSDTAGTLRGYRVPYPSVNAAIDDTGAPAGFPVENVSQDGFWVVQSEGLSNFAFTLCLNYGDLGGLSTPSQLAILQREDVGAPWIPQPSTVDTDAQQVCAEGQTSFSEFAVGGGADNPLPVELATFTGRYASGEEEVHLQWETAAETNNAGFALERKKDEGSWSEIAFLDGRGTTSTPQSYRFVDRALPFTADVLTYRLRQVDVDGTTSHSDPLTVHLETPEAVRLHSIFPNPARHQATVQYEVPEATEVRLEMYDLLGRRVRAITRDHVPAGRDAVQFNTSDLPSGLYVVRLQAGHSILTQRLTVIR